MFRNNNTLNTKRETTDIWIRNNPVLDDMELGVEIVLDNDRKPAYYNIKLGDGVTPWTTLDYFYQNLDAEDTDEILDDFTINLATRKPVANRIPIYNEDAGLKSAKVPIDDDDVVRLKELNDITTDTEQLEEDIEDLTDDFEEHIADTTAHSATDTPTASKIAMYNSDSGLKSGKIPTENNDVVRFLEFNDEISNINSKISTLNGAYYVLDSYNFGKTLDETDPDDIIILNTYAIANTPSASSMADVYNDTVIVNEFDSAEYVYNKIAGVWVKYPNGYLTIATNNHLGVVKGTQPPADSTDESKDTYVQVLSDGAMKLVGDRLGKVNTVDSVAPNSDKNIELTIAMTKAEHDALEDPVGSGLYPTLKGKTVTLTDVYPSQSAYSINRPDLWPINTEVSFGNNLYGKRQVTPDTQMTPYQTFVGFTENNVEKIISYGGDILYDDGAVKTRVGVGQNYFGYQSGNAPTLYYLYNSVVGTNDEVHQAWVHINSYYTSMMTADIWVLYKKRS